MKTSDETDMNLSAVYKHTKMGKIVLWASMREKVIVFVIISKKL